MNVVLMMARDIPVLPSRLRRGPHSTLESYHLLPILALSCHSGSKPSEVPLDQIVEPRLALSWEITCRGPSYIANGPSSCLLHAYPVFIYAP